VNRICGSEINVETNSAIIEMKADHSAIHKKVVGLPYCENWQIAHTPEQRCLRLGFIPAQKQNVTALNVSRPVQEANMEHVDPHKLALGYISDSVTVRVVVEKTEPEGTFSSLKSASRPVHQLRKVIDKRGLDLVFVGGTFSPASECAADNHDQAQKRTSAEGLEGPFTRCSVGRVVASEFQAGPPLKMPT
jgi:hypothetical protein